MLHLIKRHYIIHYTSLIWKKRYFLAKSCLIIIIFYFLYRITLEFVQPGQWGRPIIFRSLIVPPHVKKSLEENYTLYGYNQYVSDLIGVKRLLPDNRGAFCKTQCKLFKKLPRTSIIIVFFNESWTVLLRCVHSILSNTPSEILEEIILVDDFSDMKHLKNDLENYFADYPEVRVLRTEKREGIIRARHLGIEYSTTRILTFLDAHTECVPGWLEPLLDRVSQYPRVIATPVINRITEDTFEYISKRSLSMQGFTWSFEFTTFDIPDRFQKYRIKHEDPAKTPAMLGGIFTIRRTFFEELGYYDPFLEIWGGENWELSLKAWMCKGWIEIVPCSHVGHIYRLRPPYPRENILTQRNYARVAAVWMDEFTEYVLERLDKSVINNFGNITERLTLKKKLRCKPFSWYLQNVYPELFNPKKIIASGEIRNLGLEKTWCLDAFTIYDVRISNCTGLYYNQHFVLTQYRQIVNHDVFCLDYRWKVELKHCLSRHLQKSPQFWQFNEISKELRHVQTDKCLTINERRTQIFLNECDPSSELQKWQFGNYNISGVEFRFHYW